MSLFVAGGRGQYPGLFDTGNSNYGEWSGGGVMGLGFQRPAPTNDFARRYGIARLYNRNRNLLKVLSDPTAALTAVNEELGKVAQKGTTHYRKYLDEFRKLGFGEEEAQARADVMIGRDLENSISLMQLRNPYAMGGAEAGGWDPVSAALMHNPDMQRFPRTMRAINTTHMGVNEIKGRGKGRLAPGEKRRLRKKFKRQRRRRG
jgi:hypothetical protein